MNTDHSKYFRFTKKSRLEKSINSLIGLIEGVSIDKSINHSEISFLKLWISEHEDVKNLHPYNEIIPLLESSISDGILTKEEHDDIIWLCKKLQSHEYFDKVTADLQRLHAVLGGVVADGHISENELIGLANWLEENDHLKTCWPYDEIESLITTVLQDKKIDDSEQDLLKAFFSEFVAVMDDRTITSPVINENQKIVGLCAICPDITFKDSVFCFTGASTKYTRNTLIATVENLGGAVSNNITKKTQYLIIGADGNPCWSYACYGRKVEKAIELRKQGFKIQIIHENDFHDAVIDNG